MRCNNCGWENPDSNTQCEKCHSTLSSSSSHVSHENNDYRRFDPHSTVSDAVAFGSSIKQNSSDAVCPKCNYPLRPGASSCPNCGHPLSSTPKEVNKPVSKQPASILGTVNPYVNVQSKSKCILTPISFATEKSSPNSIELTDSRNELNRDNLDPGNNTITSKVQAELTNENGEWLLSDRSSQQTTFIHVGERVKLNDGDVVLMGNRMFKVHIE